MVHRRAPAPAPEISPAAVTAFRVRRHRLLARAPHAQLLAITGQVGGVQAQVLSAAGLSLWARIEGVRPDDVDKALGSSRRLVRAWCMRRTLHLLPASDLATFARGTAKRAERDVLWLKNRGVSASQLDLLMEAVLSTLEVPSTRDELAVGVARSTGGRVIEQRGGGWGNTARLSCVKFQGFTYPAHWLLHLVGAFGVVCYGEERAGQPTYVRGDRWVRGWRDVKVEEAEESLLRRYLSAYGPASAEDFASWTQMRLRDAKEVWERVGDEIAPVSLEGRVAGVLRQDVRELGRELTGEDRPSVRLLPYFDVFLLGHRSKRHLLAAEHHGKVYRPQGWVAPVVLLDGKVAGVWEHATHRGRLTVTVHPLRGPTTVPRSQLQQEVSRLGHYLGATGSDLRMRRG